VRGESGDEYLRARLPLRMEHPRALLTLLEGLALWSGTSPLSAAVSAAASARDSFACDLFGPDLWPVGSPLVRMLWVDPERRRRLRGMGNFREALAVRHREPRS
jgi:hypothetical protein